MRGKMVQRSLAWFLSVMMLCSIPVVAHAGDREYGSPQLVLASEDVYTVNAGAENLLRVTIKNKGGASADNVVVRAKSGEAMQPFKIRFRDGENVGSLGSNAYKDLNLYVDMEELPEKESYPITISYECGNGSGGSETIYIKVNGYDRDPSYLFEQMKTTPESITPGQNATLSGRITNNGGQDMFQAQLSLDQLKTEGISLSSGFSSVQLGKLKIGQSSAFSFPISTSSDMAPGNYPITIKLKYQDGAGKEYEKTQDYYVNVGGKNGQSSELIVRKMQEPQGVYDVNQNFPVHFELYNTGETIAKNIVITAEGLDAAAVVPKSTSVRNVASLAPGASVPLTFSFAATNQASTQNYAIQFSVEYTTGVDKTHTFKQYAGVNIKNSVKDKKEAEEQAGEDGKEEKTSKPKIIISKYVCDPLIVMAGQEFDLNLTLLNTHKVKNVQNIKMFLTLAEETSSETEKSGNIFTPVNSSNTYYFDSIAPKHTVDKKLRLYVVPEAQPKTYTLTVNFEYEDAKGNEYTATELLGINVKQNSELSVDQVVLPDVVEQYMPVMISLNYYNTGKVALNNVMFRIEGDVDCDQKTTYIGNMEPGASDIYEVNLTPNELGEIPITIIASYEDPSGELVEEKREFVLNVSEPVADDSEMPMEEPSSPISGKMIGILVAVIVVVGIGALFVIKKHKKKKADAFIQAIDEEDEDDKEGMSE